MEDLVIRPMGPGDLAAIRDITWRGWDGMTFRELVEKRHGPLGSKSWRDWKADDVVAGCEGHPECVLVAELDGKVVGYATFHFSQAEGYGHVGNNCVDPDCRGRGVGTALNEAVLARLRELGARIVAVTTLEHDLPARRVYEKNGFVELVRSVTFTLDLSEGEE